MPEPPRWLHKFLHMPVPPWLQMPVHDSSFEFIPKGQFTKARVGEKVGEMMWHCDSGGGGMCSVHRMVGETQLSLRWVFPCLGRGYLPEISVLCPSSPS